MLGGIRSHVRSNLIAYLALFVALGGTASAAVIAKNSVDSKSIVNGQVKKADIAKGAVTNPKIGPNAVTGAKVAKDALTGGDVNEATLGVVPSADTAEDAALLQGKAASAFAPASKVLTSGRVTMVGNDPQRTLISNGTISLLADCASISGGDRPSLTLKTSAGATAVYVSTGSNPANSSGTIADGGTVAIETFTTPLVVGTYNAAASDGKTLAGNYLARGGFIGDGCLFSVSAISG